MSLINQMLKDLEKRTHARVKPEIALSGISTSNSSREQIGKYSVTITITLLGLMIVFFSIYKLTHVVTPVQHAHAQQILVHENSVKKTNETSPPDFALDPTIVTGITLQVQENMTYLRFLLNQEVFYKVSSEGKNQKLIIFLEKTQLATDLPPVNHVSGAIKNIKIVSNKNNDLKIILTLHSGVEIKHLVLNEEGKLPELQIDFNYKAPHVRYEASEPHYGPIKTPVAVFNANQLYQQALDLISQKQNNQAITALTQLVQQFPEFTTAQQPLIKLLIQKGDTLSAKKWIELGLRQKPFYPPLIKIKAELLVSEGKILQALTLLKMASPPLEKDPEYHSLMAALYQRNNNPELAAKLYDQLLTIQPNNGIWWMGLGIALDNIGNRSEAENAFARADKADGLSPELRAFVQGRMYS